jgi:hypothetical protein
MSGQSTDATEQRLDEVLGQDEVFVVKHPSGRAGHKIHTDEDCQYLNRDDSTSVSKPASVYPAGFHDLCGECSTETQQDGGRT